MTGIPFILSGCSPRARQPQPIAIDIDAAQDGPVYGNPAGLERVRELETRLRALRIRTDHPRLFVTAETLPAIRQQLDPEDREWQAIQAQAKSGDAFSAAFVFLFGTTPDQRKEALVTAKQPFLQSLTGKETASFNEREAARLSLIFDWIYNGLTETERQQAIGLLASVNRMPERARQVREGRFKPGSIFLSSDWAVDSWEAWPEVALAHHVPDAGFCYSQRWRYDRLWGDAARWTAYVADGTPLGPESDSSDVRDALLVLNSAAGINLVDDDVFGWVRKAAYDLVYRLDFGLGREVFVKGDYHNGGGVRTFSTWPGARRRKYILDRILSGAADDPFIDQVRAEYLEKDPAGKMVTATFFAKKSLSTFFPLPLARFFPGGKEMIMRTGWRPDSTIAGFSAGPAFGQGTFRDFDVNTFRIYKQGNLAMDSGARDLFLAERHTIRYAKNTLAHNNIVVIDPSRPDEPTKIGGAPDPGGTDRIQTRTFGMPARGGPTETFLHNPRAERARILDHGITPDYDFIISDATQAYASRVREYIRTMVFIPKGEDAYVIVFDRVESLKANAIKKWLIHLPGNPMVFYDLGDPIRQLVADRFEVLYDHDSWMVSNAYDTAQIFGKVLLPRENYVVKIGGEGYDFYVQGTSNRNYPFPAAARQRMREWMGGAWGDVGLWRLEVRPKTRRKRDYFLNVLYTAGPEEWLDEKTISFEETATDVTVMIDDADLGPIRVRMPKVGKAGVEFN